MARRPRPGGSLESDVLSCLATSGEPMTPGDVRAVLGDKLAYTTVLTALRRLYDKKALTRTPRGRAYAYSLVDGSNGAKASMTAHRMRSLLDGDHERGSVLLHFVEGLDAESEQLLRDLLDEHQLDSTAVDEGKPRPRRAT